MYLFEYIFRDDSNFQSDGSFMLLCINFPLFAFCKNIALSMIHVVFLIIQKLELGPIAKYN